MGANRFNRFCVFAICGCVVAVACSGGSGELKGPGGWRGGYDESSAGAFVEAYSTGYDDGSVTLSLLCSADGDIPLLIMVSWDGREYLDGNIAAEFTYDEIRYVSQHWYSTFGDMAGPVGEDTANAFISALRGSDHLSVSLQALTGAVEAKFSTKGARSILRRMDESCK